VTLHSGEILRMADGCLDPGCAIAKRNESDTVEMQIQNGLIERMTREPLKWRWQHQTLGTEIHIAEEVVWEFQISDPPLRLTIAEDSKAPWDLTVDVPSSTAGIEVRLQNVLENEEIPICRPSAPDTKDMHVQNYFQSSARPPKPPFPWLEAGAVADQMSPPSRRLVGQDVAARLCDTLPAAQAKGFGPPKGFTGVHLNCPPTLWEGMKTTSTAPAAPSSEAHP
jgi:hypothetical protein